MVAQCRDSTVFIVDDDPAMRDSLTWLVESEGLPVQTYASAEDFLDTYDPRRPGCLVLDVQLPGMTGLALQAELVARKVAVLPIIIITAYGDTRTATRALQAGAFDFMEKPFNDDLLLGRIRQAIDLDRRGRELPC